ncbi:MAG: hypothetical protein ACRDXX_13095 [Stackebrandtia sp.]
MRGIRRNAASAVVCLAAAALLGGCGILESDTVDCVAVYDDMQDVVNNLEADEETFQKSLDNLNSSAEGIEDAELKKSVEDFGALAEDYNAAINGDPTQAAENQEEPPSIDDLTKQAEAFNEKCV